MQRRAFLLTAVIASPTFASLRPIQDQVVRFNESDWQPALLERAKRAVSNTRISEFLDSIELTAPPTASDTAREIRYLLALQDERSGNERLFDVLQLQNERPIDAMLRMCLGDGRHESERRSLVDACSAIEPFLLAAKYRFMRARPSKIDDRLQPLFEVPGHPSYPSGHAAQGFLCGEILAWHRPEKSELCREAGVSMGLGREVAGLHFPSDTVAGRHLAEHFCKQYRTDISRSM
jgi:hypothetical protein